MSTKTGPFSVVPGTHREDDGACRLGRHLERADLATALDNTDTKARRMLLYNYTHFGMKQYDWCIAKDDYRDRLARERSAWCQQLLGIERAPLN